MRYGEWPSPISAADLAGGRLRLGEGFINEDKVFWLQSSPLDKGRTTLVTLADNGSVLDLTKNWDLRTPIHEYGGTPVTCQGSRLCFYDRISTQVWVHSGCDAMPITESGQWFFGGFTFLNDHQVVCIREDHSPEHQPQDAIVILDLDGMNRDGGRVIASGADFYFALVVSNGGWLAWMEYDHPNMPWDTTRIMAQSPEGRQYCVVDTPHQAAIYPQWESDGSLIFLSDESGYWNFYRWTIEGVTALHHHPYDFCEPPWVISQPPYAILNVNGHSALGCIWWKDGMAHLGVLNPDSTLTTMGVYGTATVSPSFGNRSVVKLGSPTQALSLNLLDWSTGTITHLVSESLITMDPNEISLPEFVTWASTTDDSATKVSAWYYPPTVIGETPPPVILTPHSGPTSYSPAVFSLVKQYFTTRGIGILDLNYSGSATMGRAFRLKLYENWGILDVKDCVDGINHLISLGKADRQRVGIMGSSAGGFTTLAALTTTIVFTAGISLYGIADLEALTLETAKFESHYNQRLVAPYPEDRQVYLDRSPITHVESLNSPILIFQGELDQVVPPNQATMMYEAALAKGLEAQLVLFEDEGHGFRMASTIEEVYSKTLSFLGRIWGFSPSSNKTVAEDSRTNSDAG